MPIEKPSSMKGKGDDKKTAPPRRKATAQDKGKASPAAGRLGKAREGHRTPVHLRDAFKDGAPVETAKRRTRPLKSGSLAAAVKAALQRAADATPPANLTKLDLVADALVAKACAGDVAAIKAVFERIDGKPTAEPPSDTAPRRVVIVHSFKSAI